MNVGQLIVELSKCNPKMPVVSSGYEDNRTIVTGVERIMVTYNPENSWWEGEYEKCEDWRTSERRPVGVVAILGRRH